MSLPQTDTVTDRSSPNASKKRRPDWWLMFTKFLSHGTNIASVAPSSRFLARQLIKGIDFDSVKCIVELGAGTGPITAELLKVVKPHTKLIIMERDTDFCNRLRQRFPQADIVESDVAKLEEVLDQRSVDKVDHFISGLPLPSFPDELCNTFLTAMARRLSPDGTFRQLTLMPWVYQRFYRSYFSTVKFNFVPLNIPPSGVYLCRDFHAKTKV